MFICVLMRNVDQWDHENQKLAAELFTTERENKRP